MRHEEQQIQQPRGQEGDLQRVGGDDGCCTHSFLRDNEGTAHLLLLLLQALSPLLPMWFAFENEISTTVLSCALCYSGTMASYPLLVPLVRHGRLVWDQPSADSGGRRGAECTVTDERCVGGTPTCHAHYLHTHYMPVKPCQTNPLSPQSTGDSSLMQPCVSLKCSVMLELCNGNRSDLQHSSSKKGL